MIGISLLILMAAISVIAGFVLTEKILELKGYRRKERIRRMGLKELGRYLKERYLVSVAAISENGRFVEGVEDREIEEMKDKLKNLGCEEILLISGSDYKYALQQDGVFVLIKGKFASLEDFMRVWKLVKVSTMEVKS